MQNLFLDDRRHDSEASVTRPLPNDFEIDIFDAAAVEENFELLSRPLGFTQEDLEQRADGTYGAVVPAKFSLGGSSANGLRARVTRYFPSPNIGEDFYSRETSLCCLHCTEPINGFPIPIPIPVSAMEYQLEGQYCTVACALAATPDAERFFDMARALYGNKMPEISRYLRRGARGGAPVVIVAPPREALIKFGGHLHPRTFRAMSARGVRVERIAPPYYVRPSGFLEIEHVHNESELYTYMKAFADSAASVFGAVKRFARYRTPQPETTAQMDTDDADSVPPPSKSAPPIQTKRKRAVSSPEPPRPAVPLPEQMRAMRAEAQAEVRRFYPFNKTTSATAEVRVRAPRHKGKTLRDFFSSSSDS